MRLTLIAAAHHSVLHQAASGQPTGTALNRVLLHPGERRRVPLADVLKRVEDQRRGFWSEPCDLAARQDIRLLPAMHHIPRLPEQLPQTAAVPHHVDVPRE